MDRPGVFDVHAHLAPGAAARERLLDVMAQNGIDRAVVVAGGAVDPDTLSRQIIEGGHTEADADNASVLAACEQSGGTLVPFYFANPHREGADYRADGQRFAGLKLAPAVHGVSLLDDRTLAVVAQAQRFGHATYLHCLPKPGFGVRDLVALAAEFPTGHFVLGHAGVGDLDLHGIDLIKPVDTILFETSGGYTAVVDAAINRLGADRVVFGTEYPLQHPSVELAKYRALALPDHQWHKVAWHNARRLIGERDS
ncbi:hydrolase [Actinosynnema sp. ALI-1.44]|nr:hydrolase [Actinosynnema sp. ALI-1.44]